MYKNSSKKLSQLKSLFESLGEVYDFESKSIKPEKSTGTRWLDHKVRAMTKMNDKFGVYAKQIQNAIEEKSSSTDNVPSTVDIILKLLSRKLSIVLSGYCLDGGPKWSNNFYKS